MGNECVYYEDLKKGDSASFAKTVSESDVYQFAGITGDFNELHINREDLYSAQELFTDAWLTAL